jgi:hypothetical protein
MTKSFRNAVLLIFLTAAAGLAEVVVLKGGVIVPLQRPPVRRGNNVLLTRTDGTLLSVPASEIDAAATAALRAVPPPTPEPPPARPATLAEAARASHEVPKARVRITDANVSHVERDAQSAGNAEGAPKEKETGSGAGRVEVGDYTQEKSGEALVVRGTLRNPGATTALGVRMTVTALDAKGQAIASGEAGLSSVVIEPSKTAAFSITIPVGTKPAVSLKFSPRWVAPASPASGPGSEEPASKVSAAAPGAAPTPQPTAPPPPPPPPTPYGRGSLYAPPAPNAPSEAPKDGKTGYIPGASSPSNQPKPPN